MPDDITRLDSLERAVSGALDAVNGLPEEQRAQAPEATELLHRALGHATVVLQQTDVQLISDEAFESLTSALGDITGDPADAITRPRLYADDLIKALFAFPAAHTPDFEQAIQNVSDRLHALQSDIAQLEADAAARKAALAEELLSLGTDLEGASTRVKGRIEAFSSELQPRLNTIEATLATQQQTFDQLLTRHSEAFSQTQEERAASFSQAQEERSAAFQEEITDAKEQLASLHREARDEVEQRVAEIRRMESESSALVGAIGLAGTAERYSEEAKQQKDVADKLRLLTMACALGAVVMAVFAVVHESDKPGTVVAKLGVSAVLGALAAYTARQSGRHRVREERARNLQLELTAFAPFIEPLERKQQELERVIMARKTFGQIRALPEAEGAHDFGPLGPVEDLLKRSADDSE